MKKNIIKVFGVLTLIALAYLGKRELSKTDSNAAHAPDAGVAKAAVPSPAAPAKPAKAPAAVKVTPDGGADAKHGE